MLFMSVFTVPPCLLYRDLEEMRVANFSLIFLSPGFILVQSIRKTR